MENSEDVITVNTDDEYDEDHTEDCSFQINRYLLLSILSIWKSGKNLMLPLFVPYPYLYWGWLGGASDTAPPPPWVF